MIRVLAAVLVACAACAPGESRLFVPFPPLSGERSLVIAVERSDRVELFAQSMTSERPSFDITEMALGTADRVVLHALLYDEALDDLQIPAGAVTRAQPTDEDPRDVPDAAKMFAAEVDLSDAGAAVTWSQTSARATILDTFKLPPAQTPCAKFDIETYSVESTNHGAFALQLDDRSALVSTTDGRFHKIDLDGRITPITPMDGYAPFLSAMRATDGELWLGGQNGAMYKVHLEGDQLVRTTWAYSPEYQRIHWLTGDITADATDVYALSIEGALERFDGTTFELLHQFAMPPSLLDWKGGIARLGPAEVIAALQFNDHVIHVKDGVARPEPVPNDIGALQAATNVPGHGAVAGDSEGQVIWRGPNGWERLERSPLRVWMLSMYPYEDGFVYGSAFGNFGQYIFDYGFCPLMENTAAFAVRYLTTIGRDVILFGENPNTERTPILIFRRK